MRELAGKVAVITGAGAGIGRATALVLASEGVVVAACDLDGAAAKDTLEAIRAAGGQGSAHEVDVSAEEQMAALVPAVLDLHSVVDIVVNNAGIAPSMVLCTDIPFESYRRVLAVNLWGVLHGSLLFLPHLKTRPQANLVNVSSNAGLLGYPRMADYATSKFAVRGFSEAIRMELQSTPVRVTLVCPGSTRTQMISHSPLLEEGKRRDLQAAFDRSFGRPPEAVAKAIVTAIRKDRARAIIGPDTVAADLVARLIPGSYARLMGRAADAYIRRQLGASGGTA